MFCGSRTRIFNYQYVMVVRNIMGCLGPTEKDCNEAMHHSKLTLSLEWAQKKCSAATLWARRGLHLPWGKS